RLVAVTFTVGVMAYSAQAALVTVDGVTIFQDGFENGTVSSAPGTNDPLVGTWDNMVGNVTITNAANAGFAAYHGDQFVQVSHGPNDSFSMSSNQVNVGNV